MSTYDWPSGRDFVPSEAQLSVRHNQQRAAESPLNGDTQTSSLPGSRWVWDLAWPNSMSTASAAALEGFLVGLSGREHRVRLPDFKRQIPLGDVVLSGVTVASTAAQFSRQLQLSGCHSTVNLVRNSSFETDSNADGLADGWSVQVGGSGDVGRTHNVQRMTDNPSHGARIQFVEITAATTAADSIVTPTGRIPVDAGAVYTLSLDLRTNATGKAVAIVRWYIGTGGSVDSTIGPVTPSSYVTQRRVSGTFTAPAGAVECEIYFRGINAVGEYIGLDAVQFERGSEATAYRPGGELAAGDWLSVGGQLLMVPSRGVANDAGAMTVNVQHMLRSAVSASAAVTLSRPTGLYVLADQDQMLARRSPGAMGDGGLRARFVEVFS